MPQDADWTTRKPDYDPPQIDTTKAHSARVYDYLLGGKDNYRPDREAAEHLIKVVPSVPESVRHNRWFMRRATRYLAEEGISQFLDIGTGIPTSPNLHEIAQQVNPAARVLYVDNDPIVLAHAYARLKSSPQGQVAYIHGDMRRAEAILTAPELTATLDLSQPVALLILSTLHLITDPGEARELLRQYVAALAPGSFLALSLATNDGYSRADGEEKQAALSAHGIPVLQRTRDEAAALFAGLELIEPGVVLVNEWRPDADTPQAGPLAIGLYCGVARKP
jgi:SAM-dependent methyltransferase